MISKDRYTKRAAALAGAATLVLLTAPAKADDYTDLLDILRAKGTITQDEFRTLAARHRGTAAPARGTRAERQTRASRSAPATEDAATEARRSAADAAASAAAAQAAMQTAKTTMEAGRDSYVQAMPYTPGKGVTIRVGQVDLNFSGFVNGFYTYTSAGNGRRTVAGGLSDNSGFDSSSVRNGLLPAALIFKASTTQNGIDLAAVFGVYPGINSSNTTPLGANSGGHPVGLATAGVDFRQIYITAGTPAAGTVKVGRDIGIFGSDAILSDATLLGVGGTGGNANPANTSLGRIGLGYIYADFMPQISYASPTFAGIQGTVGVFQPLDEFNFSGLSGTSTAHNTPMFQGKLTYDYKAGSTAVRLWTSGLVQPQQAVTLGAGTAATRDILAGAFDVGAKADLGPFGLVASYYRGSGVGTTALFFDGVDRGGHPRRSDGFYVQGSWKPIPDLKLVASYGQSNLYATHSEFSPALVRTNESEIGGVYYSLTKWLTLVGEYAHVQARARNRNTATENSFTAGGILFF